MVKKRELFGYTKVKKYNDGRMEEMLCDVVLGCVTHEPKKEVVDEISRGNFGVIKKSKDFEILEVPLYE